MRCLVLLLMIVAVAVSTSSVEAKNFKDARQRAAEYEHNVKKQEVKEEYERSILNRTPSGYMTVEEYEALSRYKDKSEDKIEVPKVEKGSDMKYVPQPTYRIVRYNDPPGSPELNITKKFFKLRQYNGQGIASPDFAILVYPVVYYYPNSASTASDLFVIPLDGNDTPLNKIKKANVVKRLPEPILSTEKSIDNDSAFRTLTPIDFSPDGKKLLVKEKIGSSADGIWKTNAIVYDFETKTSYNLVELRDAIIYYWKENKNMDLDDKRWDIYPLGFVTNEPDRIISAAYAYTGRHPVFLGLWTVDTYGEQVRLVSFNMQDVQINANGFKIVQDGVVKPIIIENEEKALKEVEKADAKAKKEKDKAELKQMKKDYEAQIKQMDEEFKAGQKDFLKQQNIGGTTSFNEAPQKFKELKVKQLQKEIKYDEKQLEKQLNLINKVEQDIQKMLDLKSIKPQ